MLDPVAWIKAQYWSRRDHRSTSAGTSDRGLPVVLNSVGKLAESLITSIFTQAATESALGYTNIRFGIVSGTPRLIFELSGEVWEIDLSSDTLRIFKAGAVKATFASTGLTIAGDLTVSGNFSGWTNLSYGTGWVDFGGVYQTGQYRKIGDTIQVRGMVQRTSGVGTIIATLPALHRPPAQNLHNVQSNGALGQVDIKTDGTINLVVGSGTWVNLSDIPSFSII